LSGTSIGARFTARSGWVWLEAFDALLFTDECDDGFNVFGGEPFDRGHVPEGPMVGSRARLDGEEERPVGVVAGFVHLGEM
jgi:hypothetical protein